MLAMLIIVTLRLTYSSLFKLNKYTWSLNWNLFFWTKMQIINSCEVFFSFKVMLVVENALLWMSERQDVWTCAIDARRRFSLMRAEHNNTERFAVKGSSSKLYYVSPCLC